MSETMTTETTSVVEETPKESALKRFAKAFHAKVKAAKERVVALFGENETPVSDETPVRKTARLVLAVPKWIGHAATSVARAVLWAAHTIVGLLAFGVAALVIGLFIVFAVVTLAAYKVVQLFSLILRTPYLVARGDDCLKTDWIGYGNLWKPKYFYFTRISQVFAAQAKEAAEAAAEEQPVLSVVSDRTKHQPTPKQEKHRPAKMPVLVGADA